MTATELLKKRKIFVGVLTGNSSAAIRNRSYVLDNPDFDHIDVHEVYSAFKRLRIKILIQAVFRLIACVFADELVISTNPKWLALLGLLLQKDFTLIMGDPFVDDISRETSKFEHILWWLITRRSISLVVTSPLLQRQIRMRYPSLAVGVYLRRGFEFPKPQQPRNLNFSYFGDLGADRDSRPLIVSLSALNKKLDIYGCGHRIWRDTKYSSSVRYFDRVSPDEVPMIACQYTVTVILANKGGAQLPGKYLDFLSFPGIVLAIGFDAGDLTGLPRPNNYSFLPNDEGSISRELQRLASTYG